MLVRIEPKPCASMFYHFCPRDAEIHFGPAQTKVQSRNGSVAGRLASASHSLWEEIRSRRRSFDSSPRRSMMTVFYLMIADSRRLFESSMSRGTYCNSCPRNGSAPGRPEIPKSIATDRAATHLLWGLAETRETKIIENSHAQRFQFVKRYISYHRSRGNVIQDNGYDSHASLRNALEPFMETTGIRQAGSKTAC
ncbi:hypothetical protein B0H10DRAFT_1938219 [Mycena sp. CBHHK59/15]|nr:hypothetical protein B0H10DRAFT_1938219 [Mycena sp. CBHHK59/15]